MNINTRMKEYILHLEWSDRLTNLSDGAGARCPHCKALKVPREKHNGSCDLGKLCEDIRTIDKAAQLLSEE